MRTKKTYIVLSFRTTVEAMAWETHCATAQIPGRLIPLPLLEQILQYCAAHGARLFRDECFLALTEDGVS